MDAGSGIRGVAPRAPARRGGGRRRRHPPPPRWVAAAQRRRRARRRARGPHTTPPLAPPMPQDGPMRIAILSDIHANSDALAAVLADIARHDVAATVHLRSEEHTSELQSQSNLVCRLLLEKKTTTFDAPVERAHHSAARPMTPTSSSAPVSATDTRT